MIEVRACSVLEFGAFKEARAILAEYGQESGIEGLPTPKDDEATYLRLERAGIGHLAIATVNNELVGFIVVIVNLNPHYSVKLAVVESFFVAAAHRKSGAGLLLKKWAEETARQEGAAGILLSAPLNSRLARVMEREKSYAETHRVFFRSFA